MATLSEEKVPELLWQVVQERIERHKKVGMIKWIYYISLKTLTNQVFSLLQEGNWHQHY